MKRQARHRAEEEAARLEAAALSVQCRWRIRCGGLALHMKRQARHRAEEEAARLEAAALRVQCRWRIRRGGLALHMKRQALARKALDKQSESDAEKIARVKALEIKDCGQRKREAAALRVQSTWRKHKGNFSEFLLLRAKASSGLSPCKTTRALSRADYDTRVQTRPVFRTTKAKNRKEKHKYSRFCVVC
jgi:hypothetical protein